MITFFTCPKSFKDNFKIIQLNAIKSWLNLDLEKEILLCGKEEGIEDICNNLNLKHIKNIDYTSSGIPILSSIFALAEQNSKYNILCFINTDIILFGNFEKIVTNLKNKFDKFIGSGIRTNINFSENIDFNSFKDQELIDYLKNFEDKRKKPLAPDYFIFAKGTFKTFPDFLIGRFFYDNWIYFYAYKNKIPMVDLTNHIIAFHQNHDYSFDVSDYLYDKAIENDDIIKNFYLAGFGATFEADDFSYILDNDLNIINKKISYRKKIKYLLKYIYLRIIFSFRNKKIRRFIYKIFKKIKTLITKII